jgi:hypothetical protein
MASLHRQFGIYDTPYEHVPPRNPRALTLWEIISTNLRFYLQIRFQRALR